MTDKEIFDIVDKVIERYTVSTNTFISMEMDSVRHEIKGIKEEFTAMNGRLRDVCQWKDQHEGALKAKEKGFNAQLQLISIVIAFLILCSGAFFGFRKLGGEINTVRKSVELQNEMTIDGRGFAPTGVTRGDTIQ